MMDFFKIQSQALFNVVIVKEQKRNTYFPYKFRILGGVWLCWLSGAHAYAPV